MGTPSQPFVRVIFTQGGKGGVAKTEVMLSLVTWFREQNLDPLLLDFDVENTNKSSLQNFYPEAVKLDIHREGALDEFFDVCDDGRKEGARLVLADMGSGSGAATYRWFDQAYEDARELNLHFTSIGVTTNEPGAVQSVLKWALQLQDRVEYIIVLNELREPGSAFEYWHDEPAVARFVEAFQPGIVPMQSRVTDFQSELRNHSATLQAVIDGEVEASFLRMTRNIVRARRYQRELFEGFNRVALKLLPPAQDS